MANWSNPVASSCMISRLIHSCLLLLLGWTAPPIMAKYPNEIIDTPIVSCEQDTIAIKIRTSSANPSHIYAEDFHDTPKCMVRNQNKVSFGHGECGMTMEHLDNPGGTMYRICLSVQIHPLFVTDSDRSYCAQCVYMDSNLVDDLERNIAISEMTPNELDPQFDDASNPQCSYSIRKGTVDGPEVHAAVVGETVFHVWQCNNENVGILVQNCHVEDLQGDKILIIDQNGCGVDQYLFRTPQYSNDLHTAFLQSSVFKFVDKSMTRFRCQLRLCVKHRGQGCDRVTPPSNCPSVDDSDALMPSSASSSSGSSSSPGSAAVLGGGSPPSLSPTAELLRRPLISPPSGRVEPPSSLGGGGTLGRDGGGNNGGGALGLSLSPPPGASLVSGGSDLRGGGSGGGGNSPKPPGGNNDLIGPPSIRPFGPGGRVAAGGTQIVSGRTSEQTASSGGGYPYYHRERRSSLQMLYANGPSASARSRRETGRRGNRQDGMQELDVVGLIRVLDNPDDIQYYADHQNRTFSPSSSSSESPPVMVQEQQQPSAPIKTMQAIQSSRPRLQLVPRPPAPIDKSNIPQFLTQPPQLHPLPSAKIEEATAAAEEGKSQPMDAQNCQQMPPAAGEGEANGIEKRQGPEEQQTCLRTGTFWSLLLTLASLLCIQLCIVALILVDRLLLNGKYLSKKVQKLMTTY